MNGKHEDKLARLAFGELSPSETARVEAELNTDPDAARAVASFRNLRNDLLTLQEIPEDQFSKERLRDAILAQGLRPAVNTSSHWGWLWMPAAACVLAFGMMVFKTQPRGEPRLVTNEPANIQFGAGLSQPVAGLSGDERASKPSLPSAARHDFVNEKPQSKVAMRDVNRLEILGRAGGSQSFRHQSSRRRRHYEPDSNLFAMSLPAGAFDPGFMSPASQPGSRLGATADSNPHNTVVAAESPTPSSPIVLIDQDKDSSTGAYRATEVGSSSNVLVGG